MNVQYFKSKYGYEIGGMWYPRITAICSTIAKPGLLRYYANQENFAVAQENLTRASNWGKLLHETMEKILQGEEVKIDSVISPSISAFEDWKNQYNISVLEVEKRVMSKNHSYAGTFDLLVEINGKLGILDLKTSKGIWDEYSLQIAAYVQAFNEMALPKAETRWILRIDQYQKCEFCQAKKRTKDTTGEAKGGKKNCSHKLGQVQGEWEFKELNNQDRDIEAFLAAKKVWEWQNHKILAHIDNRAWSI